MAPKQPINFQPSYKSHKSSFYVPQDYSLFNAIPNVINWKIVDSDNKDKGNIKYHQPRIIGKLSIVTKGASQDCWIAFQPVSNFTLNIINLNTDFSQYYRSQLSICSEPTTTIRQLSGQSSLEPCVLEESPELEESQHLEETASGPSTSLQTQIEEDIAIENSQDCLVHANLKKSRPNSLILDASGENSKSSKAIEAKKFLYRSRSSRTFYRPKPRLINEYDPIYFISTDGSIRTRPYDKDEELYDSLQVINERRSKILTTTTTTTTSTISSDIIESSGENCILEASNTLEEFDEDNKSLESLSDAATSMVDPKTQDKSVAPPLEEKDIVLVHNAMLLENDECSRHDATNTVLTPTSPAGGKSELIENKCEEHGQETTENEVLDTRIIMEADAE